VICASRRELSRGRNQGTFDRAAQFTNRDL
jgi:hypothetical protein